MYRQLHEFRETVTRRSPLAPLRFGLLIAAALLAANLLPNRVQAQTYPRTRLENVTPPGAKSGSTVDVTLRGADLDDVNELIFSDTRIKAQFVPPPKPKIDPKTKKPKKVKPGPPKFKVTVPANVPVGIYDVRAVGKWGISNPRAFAVGDLKEVSEKEANNDITQMQKVDVNTTVNGVISGNTDVDYFTFSGKKGQRIVIYCAAAEIDSRLDPLVEVYRHTEDGGELVAANRGYSDRNAALGIDVAVDGEYYVRVCQFAYTYGGTQSFYRLRITTAPWIDAVYPPVIQVGKAANVTLFGKNLPGGQIDNENKEHRLSLEKATVQINPPMGPMNERRIEYSGMLLPQSGTIAGFEHRVKNAAGSSNPALITYSEEPVVLDNGKNDDPDQAQKITLPSTLCGRIERNGDRDWFAFTAKKGEVYTFEGIAERLGSPCDVYMHLWRVTKTTDPKTKKEKIGKAFVSTYNSHLEIPARVGRFSLESPDPKGRYVIPADGEYKLMVSSGTAFTRSGPRFVYRVNIRKEEPDFRLILVSNDTANVGGFMVHRGGCQHLSVILIRSDGFNDGVLLEADGLPKGVTCRPQWVGNRLKSGVLVFEAADNAPDWAGAITVKGTAAIDGKKVVRKAQAGVLVWPAPNNVPAISRLARSICLSVREKGPYSLTTNLKELEIPVGGKGEIKVTAKKQLSGFNQQVQVVRAAAPALTNGNFANFPNVNIPKGKTQATIKYTLPNNTVPGTYTLVFEGKSKYQYAPDPKNKKKKRNTDVYETTPPIKVVVYNKVGELSFANPKLKVVAGKIVDLVVRVKRMHKYDGEFKLQLLPASGFSGISAKQVTLGKGKNDVKMTIATAKNAKVGSSPEFKIRASARVGNVTFTHEAKFELTIAKASS